MERLCELLRRDREAVAEEELCHLARTGTLRDLVRAAAGRPVTLETPSGAAALEPDLGLVEEVGDVKGRHEAEGVERIGGVEVTLAQHEGAQGTGVVAVARSQLGNTATGVP